MVKKIKIVHEKTGVYTMFNEVGTWMGTCRSADELLRQLTIYDSVTLEFVEK